jgi:peptidoglycan hydrolase-like protein with peptidoglycan-binding domain
MHAAVTSFQARHGLVTDGFVGPDTASALGLAWPVQPAAEDVSLFETASSRANLAPATAPPAAAVPVADARPAHADPTGFGRAGAVMFDFDKGGRKVFATPSGGQRFYVGTDVPYEDDMPRRGLAQSSRELQLLQPSGAYDRKAEAQRIDKWAHFLWPTIMAESSGYFGRVNSYDRAAFTFGCYQFAAHTPRENLILLFRRLLTLPGADSYFPDLKLHNNASGVLTVHRIGAAGGLVDLEVEEMVRRPNGSSERQIPHFMRYLNSDSKAVDTAEMTAAARLMLWCAEDDAPRREQLSLAVETAVAKMKATRNKVPAFDGSDWKVALWINDIRHQGRAKYSAIAGALGRSDAVEALSQLGASVYDGRKNLVRKLIAQLDDEGVLTGWAPDLS